MLMFGIGHTYECDIGVTHVRGFLPAGVLLPNINMQEYLIIHVNIKIIHFQSSLSLTLLLSALLFCLEPAFCPFFLVQWDV
jgi:hypothetical protein